MKKEIKINMLYFKALVSSVNGLFNNSLVFFGGGVSNLGIKSSASSWG